MFSRSELRAMIISIIIVTLAFAFDDKSLVFQWSYWLSHLFSVFIMVAIALFAQQFGHKLVAKWNGFSTEYSLWGIQSFVPTIAGLVGKKKTKTFPRTFQLFGKEYLIRAFPIGIVLALLVMLISNGKLFFVAVGEYALLIKKPARFGRKFLEVSNYEEAKIALAGPVANLILMLIAAFFNSYGTFDTFILINGLLAFFYMLPLPRLPGIKIYFGSPLLYVSTLVFTVSMILLVYNVGAIPLLIISLLSLFVSGSLYYYYSYFR
ncbi:hypothetical protein HZA98_01890 [Candidatus Woesearchaeota archaeon]|nr:hypothetical protein [Candidatus Woesearchaeota archaeon]